jgi:molybdopterin/thiamine biosynthesis adenylyltransferase
VSNERDPFSRPRAAADGLADDAPDRHRFVDKQVLLTTEPEVLESAIGLDTWAAAFLLLPRICRQVVVVIPTGRPDIEAIAMSLAATTTWSKPVDVVFEADPARFDAILCVGRRARPGLPWSVISADGWLAKVSSGSSDLPASRGRRNPMTSLAAASLGVADVWKRLIALRPGRGRLLDGLSFSLLEYSLGLDEPGPEIERIRVELLLAGAGAIGNGAGFALERLPLDGHVSIVDPQRYEPPNFGTCILLPRAAVRDEKAAHVAGRLIESGVDAKGYIESLATFAARVDAGEVKVDAAIGGLDNIDARHDLQRIWPDVVLDGAIGDFACQVSRHPWGEDVACEICLFRHPPGERSERRAARLTGLREDRIRDADALIDDEDVKAAPTHLQGWLAERRGRAICSVIPEALAAEVSTNRRRRAFAPSVPFVATFAAAMAVAELVKSRMGIKCPLEPRFQLDLLTGPQAGLLLPQGRRADCECVERRANIERARRARR